MFSLAATSFRQGMSMVIIYSFRIADSKVPFFATNCKSGKSIGNLKKQIHCPTSYCSQKHEITKHFFLFQRSTVGSGFLISLSNTYMCNQVETSSILNQTDEQVAANLKLRKHVFFAKTAESYQGKPVNYEIQVRLRHGFLRDRDVVFGRRTAPYLGRINDVFIHEWCRMDAFTD